MLPNSHLPGRHKRVAARAARAGILAPMVRCAPEVQRQACEAARFRCHGSAIFVRLVARNDQRRWSSLMPLPRLPRAISASLCTAWLDNRALDLLGAGAGVLRPVKAGDVGSTRSAAGEPFGRTLTGAVGQLSTRRWAAGAVVQLHNGRLAAVKKTRVLRSADIGTAKPWAATASDASAG
jgi:hypothetical protein